MVAPDELLSMLERILPLIERDSSVLEGWSKTEDGQKVVQFVIQIGKYNTNFGRGKDISIGDELNRNLLEEIRDLLRVSLREATPTQQSHPLPNVDWQQVSRSRLDEQIQRLTTNPLTHAEGITYRTEQVYVPLGLVERKKVSRRKEDVSPEQGSLLYEETEITQRFEHEAFLEQVLRQGHSPRSGGRRIAVIGEPGAGKTTLLQQIARWVSDNIDGAITIWVSLADLQGQELENYLLKRWLPAVVQQVRQAEALTQVKDAFVAQVQQGRVWLLLDGVDEMQVASGNPLSEIERQMRLGGLLSQSRIVLTCRLNLWDGNRHALDTFDTYRTLEFSYPVQVEQFVGQWFEALPDAQAGQAERLCAALKQPGKERIRDLVKNPLRLTLLCFNWYLGEGTLPETKAGLYEQFVADFYEWKRERFPTTAEQRRQLNAALGELAREAIDKEEMRFRLRHDFVCEYLGQPDAPNSLFHLALQLGWLNQVGVDAENRRKAVYAFFHPTFQEYFAALAINEWSFFLTHIRDNPNHPNAIYRAFEARWKEVILLWLGKSNTPEILKEQILSELINFQDNSGGSYSFKAYFLAAEGIREFREYSEIESERVILEIIKYAFGYFDKQHQKWCFFLKPVCQEARRIIRNSLERRKTERYLLQLIDSCSEPSVRWHIANTLDSLGTTNRKLQSILVTGVSSKLEPHVAKSLDQLAAQIRVLKDRDLSSQKDEEFLVLENEAEEIQGFEDN
jgi:predicted NACHT family NTPase